MNKKGTLSNAQAKKMLPTVKKFNSLGEFFIKLLQKRVDEKRKKVQRIRVMVSGIKKPAVPAGHHSFQITSSKFNPKFWEKKKKEETEQSSTIDLPWKNTDYGKGNKGIML